MNVCVVGGGHIGTTLACYIKHMDPQKKVTLYTQHPKSFSKHIKCNDIEHKISYSIIVDEITNDPSAAAPETDIFFIALPHFAVEQACRDIAPYVKPDAYIGVLPGGGGCEFFFHKYFPDSVKLFGFQRVPFTAKLVKYGEETNLKSWKRFSVIGTLKRDALDKACQMVTSCGLQVEKAENYLSIALTPTNPLLHTARTYEIFGPYDKSHEFPCRSKFYVGWTDEASHTLLSMDAELHNMLSAITSIDTTAIRPLTEHYESPTAQDLTRKINSIPTFQTVWAPMITAPNRNGAFIADVNSRMFTEDFPWGLAIIRAYFDFFDIEAPTMDRVLRWYANYMGLEWYIDGVFCGKDLASTGIPQRYGISTKGELLSYYNQ